MLISLLYTENIFVAMIEKLVKLIISNEKIFLFIVTVETYNTAKAQTLKEKKTSALSLSFPLSSYLRQEHEVLAFMHIHDRFKI